MKKFLYSDTSLKIISVLVAVLMWMYVVGIRNPVVEIAYRAIPIAIDNQTAFEQRGLEIVSLSAKTSDVRIKGRHADVSKVTADKIFVSVDARDISKPGTYTFSTKASVLGNNVTVSEVIVKNIDISVDYIITSTKNVVIETSGEIKTDCIMEEIVPSATEISVQGPKQKVDLIDHALVRVDIGGEDSFVTSSCQVVLLDKNGNEVDFKFLTLSDREITVEVPIYKTKKVPIEVLLSQELDKKEHNFNITVEPSEITILGDKEIINGISKIETQIIDVNSFINNENSYFETEIIVPENVRIQEPISKVRVSVYKNN